MKWQEKSYVICSPLKNKRQTKLSEGCFKDRRFEHVLIFSLQFAVQENDVAQMPIVAPMTAMPTVPSTEDTARTRIATVTMVGCYGNTTTSEYIVKWIYNSTVKELGFGFQSFDWLLLLFFLLSNVN